MIASGVSLLIGVVTATVDPEAVLNEISPYIYGGGFEDVNHEIYGGLDAQRLYGESFEESPHVKSVEGFELSGWWLAEGKQLRGEPCSRPDSLLRLKGMTFPAKGFVEFECQYVSLEGAGGLRIGDQKFMKPGWSTYDTKGHDLTMPVYQKVLSSEHPELVGKPIEIFGRVKLHYLRINDGATTREITLDRFEFVDQASRWWRSSCKNGGRIAYDTEIRHQGRASQRLMPGGGTAGLSNRGLHEWGISCRAGKPMDGFVYVRGKVDLLAVRLTSADGTRSLATTNLSVNNGDEWRRVDFSLVPNATDAKGSFVIEANGAGEVWVDDVYLADRPTNKFGRLGVREDIVAALQREGLRYLRWGGTMANADDYRLPTFGKARLPHRGHWYRDSSGGFGPREFIELAAAMGLPCAVSISIHDTTSDAVDLAKWCSRFEIPICIQIGNEERFNTGDGSKENPTYVDHICRLVPPMKAANPKLTFAGAVNWTRKWGTDKKFRDAFPRMDGLIDYWDIHFFFFMIEEALKSRELLPEFLKEIKSINPSTKMRAAVFEENSNQHNMERALCTALNKEYIRAAGLDCLTACTANGLQASGCNDNGWDQGFVHFTPDKVWLTPAAWGQQMASESHRELLVRSDSSAKEVSISATRDRKGDSLVLHLVNIADQRKPLTLQIKGNGYVLHQAKALFSEDGLKSVNTAANPEKVVPRDVTAAMQRQLTLEAYSYTVMEFRRQCHRGSGTANIK